MAIRQPIELSWNGKTHKLLITMDVIDRLEDSLNLMQLVHQAGTNDVRFSKVAKLFSVLLQCAGEDVTQEEVFQGMFGGGNVDMSDVVGVLEPVLLAIFPAQQSEKKSSEPRKPKSKTATRGKKSTS